MATQVVRKSSICRIGVALKIKTKLYFYRMWCGTSYFQNYYSIPNPIPLSFHDIVSIQKALKLYADTSSSNHTKAIVQCCHGMHTVASSRTLLSDHVSRPRLKCDGTRAETRFRLSVNWTSPFKSVGQSVQSTTGSRGVCISGSNADTPLSKVVWRVLATHSIS